MIEVDSKFHSCYFVGQEEWQELYSKYENKDMKDINTRKAFNDDFSQLSITYWKMAKQDFDPEMFVYDLSYMGVNPKTELFEYFDTPEHAYKKALLLISEHSGYTEMDIDTWFTIRLLLNIDLKD